MINRSWTTYDLCRDPGSTRRQEFPRLLSGPLYSTTGGPGWGSLRSGYQNLPRCDCQTGTDESRLRVHWTRLFIELETDGHFITTSPWVEYLKSLLIYSFTSVQGTWTRPLRPTIVRTNDKWTDLLLLVHPQLPPPYVSYTLLPELPFPSVPMLGFLGARETDPKPENKNLLTHRKFYPQNKSRIKNKVFGKTVKPLRIPRRVLLQKFTYYVLSQTLLSMSFYVNRLKKKKLVSVDTGPCPSMTK